MSDWLPGTLDYDYSCSYFCPGLTRDEVINNCIQILGECADQNLAKISQKQLDVEYFEGNKIDIWGEESKNIFAFIHGGYFYEGNKEYASTHVQTLVDLGIQVVNIGYTLAPAVTITEQIRLVRKAVEFIRKRNPDANIVLSGHSAGALLAEKAVEDTGIASMVNKLILISGIYQLQELISTYIGKEIHLTLEEAKKASTDYDLLKASFKGPIHVLVGKDESPKFLENSSNLAMVVPNAKEMEPKAEDIKKSVTIAKEEASLAPDNEWTSVAATLKKTEKPTLQQNVSKAFLPKRSQTFTDTWKRKGMEKELNKPPQTGPYSFTPFSKNVSSNSTFNPHTLPDTIYGVRAASAIPRAQMNRGPSNAIGSRPGSALDNPYGAINRPDSRTGSEYGIPKVASRYQSYTTLPRPEQIEADNLNIYATTGRYGLYGGTGMYGRQPQQESLYGLTAANMMKTMSRPHSAMSSHAMPSIPISYGTYMNPAFSMNNIHLGQPASTTIQSKLGPARVSNDSINYNMKEDLINAGALSICASMQVVTGICFVVIGIVRFLMSAKWAFGMEVLFGFLVILSAGLGLIGLRNKRYACTTANFILSIIISLVVFVPLAIGLLPILPFQVRTETFVFLVGNDEPYQLDLGLTVIALLQFVLSLLTSILGCKAWGGAIHHVEQLRLRDVIREVYPKA
uniref:Abhydrolase_3 domain-containing protein n=1 Tax=Rhabditophanes sp. KR3021 TaxID=114890 RepID=A0AC35TW68_9BILA